MSSFLRVGTDCDHRNIGMRSRGQEALDVDGSRARPRQGGRRHGAGGEVGGPGPSPRPSCPWPAREPWGGGADAGRQEDRSVLCGLSQPSRPLAAFLVGCCPFSFFFLLFFRSSFFLFLLSFVFFSLLFSFCFFFLFPFFVVFFLVLRWGVSFVPHFL